MLARPISRGWAAYVWLVWRGERASDPCWPSLDTLLSLQTYDEVKIIQLVKSMRHCRRSFFIVACDMDAKAVGECEKAECVRSKMRESGRNKNMTGVHHNKEYEESSRTGRERTVHTHTVFLFSVP